MKDKLFALGFREGVNAKNILFLTIKDYTINVQIDSNNVLDSVIDYGQKIKVHHKNICTLAKEENLVQLECVVRLLKKGYKPNHIELEKTYKLGHDQKGRLWMNQINNGQIAV